MQYIINSPWDQRFDEATVEIRRVGQFFSVVNVTDETYLHLQAYPVVDTYWAVWPYTFRDAERAEERLLSRFPGTRPVAEPPLVRNGVHFPLW